MRNVVRNGNDNPFRGADGHPIVRAVAPEAPAMPTLQQRLLAAHDIERKVAALANFRRERQGTDNSWGFTSLAEFADAVRRANPAVGDQYRLDPRLAAPTNVIGGTGDAAGAYLVPPEFRAEIVSLVYGDDDPIVRFFVPQPTGKNRVQLVADATTPWGTNGVQAAWRVEAEQMTPSRSVLDPREIPLNELYAFVLATEELIEDAPRARDLLTVQAAQAIRWKLADAIVNGDGVAKPLGYMASDALVTVAKESGQIADTIVRQNVARMYARILNPGRAFWIANSDILPTLMDLRSDAGEPLWHPEFPDAPSGALLGRPLYTSEHAKTVGDLGDLQFVNPQGYLAFKRQNAITFAESIHLYFDFNLRAFRWTFRVGGQPLLSAPVSPANGSYSKSHFVALEAR